MACYKFRKKCILILGMQIIQIQYLNIFSIQFWYKKLFLLFFNPWLREERDKMTDSSSRERKVSFTSI